VLDNLAAFPLAPCLMCKVMVTLMAKKKGKLCSFTPNLTAACNLAAYKYGF